MSFNRNLSKIGTPSTVRHVSESKSKKGALVDIKILYNNTVYRFAWFEDQQKSRIGYVDTVIDGKFRVKNTSSGIDVVYHASYGPPGSKNISSPDFEKYMQILLNSQHA